MEIETIKSEVEEKKKPRRGRPPGSTKKKKEATEPIVSSADILKNVGMLLEKKLGSHWKLSSDEVLMISTPLDAYLQEIGFHNKMNNKNAVIFSLVAIAGPRIAIDVQNKKPGAKIRNFFRGLFKKNKQNTTNSRQQGSGKNIPDGSSNKDD